MGRFLIGAVIVVFAALGSATATAAAPAKRILAVGGGEITGYYYPIAGALCRLVNKDRARHGLTCVVEPTAGSAANLAELRAGEVDLAVVQGKAQSQAFQGTGPFVADGAFADLRSMVSLHGEALAVLARRDQVKTLADLKGKRVNLGRPGSFQRSMAEAVTEAMGWTLADYAQAAELDPTQQAKALCDGTIDAIFVTAVHPVPEVEQAMSDCGATAVEVKGTAIDALVRKTSWLVRATIPAESYEAQAEPVATIGVRATLVASTRLPPEIAYEVMKAVFENLRSFTAMHPVLQGLTKDEMIRTGMTASLHDGAQRFLHEAGLQ